VRSFRPFEWRALWLRLVTRLWLPVQLLLHYWLHAEYCLDDLQRWRPNCPSLPSELLYPVSADERGTQRVRYDARLGRPMLLQLQHGIHAFGHLDHLQRGNSDAADLRSEPVLAFCSVEWRSERLRFYARLWRYLQLQLQWRLYAQHSSDDMYGGNADAASMQPGSVHSVGSVPRFAQYLSRESSQRLQLFFQLCFGLHPFCCSERDELLSWCCDSSDVRSGPLPSAGFVAEWKFEWLSRPAA
jgi:hypothetical protein